MSEQHEALWHEGVNRTADAVVLSDDGDVLLILRSNGQWALPGGFVDDESSLTAAAREVVEETGLELDDDGQLVYSGKVDDPRNSDRRWIETDAYVFRIPSSTPVTGMDDAKDADWFPAATTKNLYASHDYILSRALEHEAAGQLAQHVRSQPALSSRGGHMSYEYRLVEHDGGHLFMKAHDPTVFSDSVREQHSRRYLTKEHQVLTHLRDTGYVHIPSRFLLHQDTALVLEGFAQAHGWQWSVPGNERERYIRECLDALRSLEMIEQPLPVDDIEPSLTTYQIEGWNALKSDKARHAVRAKIRDVLPQLRDESRHYGAKLIDGLELLQSAPTNTPAAHTAITHHDARQANIAWHPDHGVRVIDWSWSGPGVSGADTTSFLIDLAKSGHDVSNYMDEYFNPDHAHTLIGFWLGHSLWPTRDGNETVRLHQIASAVVAYQLLATAGDAGSDGPAGGLLASV